jgi:hypothetical protein
MIKNVGKQHLTATDKRHIDYPTQKALNALKAAVKRNHNT